MVGSEHFFKFQLLRLGINSVLKIFSQKVIESINKSTEGFCIKAPATPGLLMIIFQSIYRVAFKNPYFLNTLIKNLFDNKTLLTDVV